MGTQHLVFEVLTNQGETSFTLKKTLSNLYINITGNNSVFTQGLNGEILKLNIDCDSSVRKVY